MSGGHFDYKQHCLTDIAEDIEEMILNNDSVELDKYGDKVGYGFTPDTMTKFKEAVIALKKAAVMAQRVDWLVSGDDGEDCFMRRWDEELKAIDQ